MTDGLVLVAMVMIILNRRPYATYYITLCVASKMQGKPESYLNNC